ncbi:DNA-3-methyladenine glycosylase Mag1 [Schizosaccharomyces cryophilus OY26]|uniref:DNA-3-methyladenine glycosylase Mag1 n=1 Tax=Schizosaccharomyces cryophilus (strain OY26 / ATCC MYA-4695 / CBS 11777 / NBRC 106824 / NRRL Y48691) TaxID=653667 RepID=S9W013_SCHCR|nr:DNA-3-methyladenine glycosylase Mag1 [Schizosaccharomyces cryophilus OY26]EPY53283.1 DNA-3-methyladenine glycosylase Mag1 [Schizosaccharomyces cryophilus OY26]
MTVNVVEEAKKKVVLSSTEAETFLSKIDKRWERLVQLVGDYRPVVKHPSKEPYEELIQAVAGQQLHKKAADTIFERFKKLGVDGHFPSPKKIVEMDAETLRSCGFSARKAETIRSIAEASLTGTVPSRKEAETLTDEDLIERLTKIKGIGRWTVEMLLIFSLNRPDIMPADDLIIRNGYRYLHDLRSVPTKKYVLEQSEVCAPYRSIAAWYLWRTAKLPDYVKVNSKLTKLKRSETL